LRLMADRALFPQVIQNLVSNSIKFCNPGGHVVIFAPEGGGSVIAVRDTGVGVRPDMVPNLFKPEIKTTTPGTAGEKGTGLGLPMCKEILEAHGGAIRVESEPGKGSVFHAELPSRKPLALIVDGDTAARETLAREFHKRDIETVEAPNGREALALMQKAPPDVIVTEIELPVMDGLAFIQKIKSAPAFTLIPVFVDSHSAGRENKLEALEMGVKNFIDKSIPASGVVRSVETLW